MPSCSKPHSPEENQSPPSDHQHAYQGSLSGLAGVICFAGSLPATKVALGAFDPLFLTSIRAVIAAVISSLLLLWLRPPRPQWHELGSLTLVALGVVVGFPLLTALALQYVSSAYSIVFVGLLPLCTALFGMLRNKERPHPAFWLCSVLGSSVVAGYMLTAGIQTSLIGNGLMLGAILLCALGYSEGAHLSRRLGGWQVISWALLIAFPGMLSSAILTFPFSTSARQPDSALQQLGSINVQAWLGLGYVSLFSMLIGFIFWYRGLALGGVTAISQLQLLQPFIGLGFAAFLLRERVTLTMVAVTAITLCCVLGAKHFASSHLSNKH